MHSRVCRISDLICSDCGNKFSVPRSNSRLREKYHIKDIYCPNCERVTKHIEVYDLDILKCELEFKEQLNEMEQLLYDLIHKEEKEVQNER